MSGEERILEIEVSTGCSLLCPAHLFGLDFSLGGKFGWLYPINRLVVLSPNLLIRRQRPKVNQGDKELCVFFIACLSTLHLEP